MNDNYGMNDNNANAMNEGWDKRPVDATQTVEARQEENKEWQEQVKGPEDTTQAVEARQEEKKEWQEQAPTQDEVKSEPVTWLKGEEIDELRSRWNLVQIKFVDDPRTSVEQADALVTEALERIKQAFSNQRTTLNEQWVNHEDISTDDHRNVLKSYRSFLNRLLAL
jgi:hypothetical protein